MPLLSTLLALLDTMAKAALAHGANQQLELVQKASCSLLSQLLDDGITALYFPFGASPRADSSSHLCLPIAETTREHGLPDVHLANALGKQLQPNMLEEAVNLFRWLRTGPCSCLAATASSLKTLEWLSGLLLIAAMQCFCTKQLQSTILPPASQVTSTFSLSVHTPAWTELRCLESQLKVSWNIIET